MPLWIRGNLLQQFVLFQDSSGIKMETVKRILFDDSQSHLDNKLFTQNELRAKKNSILSLFFALQSFVQKFNLRAFQIFSQVLSGI